jgi:hypothetical protein
MHLNREMALLTNCWRVIWQTCVEKAQALGDLNMAEVVLTCGKNLHSAQECVKLLDVLRLRVWSSIHTYVSTFVVVAGVRETGMAAGEVMGTALLLMGTTREVEEVIQAEAEAMALLHIQRLAAGTPTAPVAMGPLKVATAQLPATRHLLQHRQLPLLVSVS